MIHNNSLHRHHFRGMRVGQQPLKSFHSFSVAFRKGLRNTDLKSFDVLDVTSPPVSAGGPRRLVQRGVNLTVVTGSLCAKFLQVILR